MLLHLERTNLLLIPLHGRGWFRFHHLFGAFAQSALEVEHPERVTELHRRGAQWFAARNDVEQAVHHTMAAGDLEGAAALVQKNWLSFFDAGRSSTVSGWLRAFHGTAADDGAAATVTGAWLAALTGDRPELRRREVALESMTGDDPLPDGTTSAQSALMLIRGLFGFAGPDRMLADAERAILLEPDTSTLWHAVACAALGHAGFVTGDVSMARARLGEAARSQVAPVTARVLALGTLSLCEAEQGNHRREREARGPGDGPGDGARHGADAASRVRRHRPRCRAGGGRRARRSEDSSRRRPSGTPASSRVSARGRSSTTCS